MVPRTKHIEN